MFPGLPIVQSLIDSSILQAIKKLNGAGMRLHKNSIAAYIVRASAIVYMQYTGQVL